MECFNDVFVFDGVSSDEYGLTVYEIDSTSSEVTNTLAPSVEIIEDRTSLHYRPLHYGVTSNTPLEFDMTFGADMDLLDEGKHFDRWELDAIARWLTAHDTYKWLEIPQPDMEPFRYRCFITDLKHVDYNGSPLAFKCTVVCDSPYAYSEQKVFKYTVSSSLTVRILNESAYMGYYKPDVNITVSSGTSFSVKNVSTGDTMNFSGEGSTLSNLNGIYIDGTNEVITSGSGVNPYEYFNFNFLKLCPGENELLITGNGTIEIICEFPMSIGGW